MPQTGTYDDAEETIEEEWLELRVVNLLFFVQPRHNHDGEGKAKNPERGVPQHGDGSDMENLLLWLPVDKQRTEDGGKVCHSIKFSKAG